jgi:prevent-host-death family protein
MHSEWQLQEARNGLSHLIKEAVAGEPQFVTLHGKPVAVVVSVAEYERLTCRHKGKLSTALLRPDIAGDDIDLSRDGDTGRNTAL